jgi:LDH2 family malate/lactate/ureidoglycolate dehydrogenase
MRLSYEELKTFSEKLLTSFGVDPWCAASVAEMLLDAELTGVATHGVTRLAIYMQRMEKGLVSKGNDIEIVQEGPSSVVIDAHNTLGAPAARFAMERCVDKAADTGCCFATVRNSNHFGTAAHYTKMAARQGMIGFACTNLTGKIAPYGAAEAFMGTNPISVAVPTEDDVMVLDMTPSVVALGKLILAQKLGQQIPLGWALDQEGNPTTDPAAGRKGSLLPIGGPKGSGMAIMVEVLSGILSGAGYASQLHDLYEFDAPQGVGHFIGAVDIGHFIDLQEFCRTVSNMIREIKSLKCAAGFDEILMPGERGAKCAKNKLAEGIEVPQIVVDELRELGRTYGLTL